MDKEVSETYISDKGGKIVIYDDGSVLYENVDITFLSGDNYKEISA